MARLIIFPLIFIFVACSSTYKNQNIVGKSFVQVKGTSLDGREFSIPSSMSKGKAILLIGYKQNSQFDIDRWLIGLDMKGVTTPTYELPTIQGLFPQFFSTQIDNGMRKGIPKDLWKGVITIYKDGDRVQKFTGNTFPNNARVVLLNKEGKILFFYDNGFSVKALNRLIQLL